MVAQSKNTHFIITYREPQEGNIVKIKAHEVSDSTLGLSFVAISDFIFDTGTLVLDPTEEDQKRRFEGVKTLHLSIYTIIAIEEVGIDHKGLKFKKDRSNLVVLSTEHQSPK